MLSRLKNPWAIIWIASFSLVLAWSAWHPKDMLIWVLEVAPAIIAALLLLMTLQKFPFTPLTYVFILVHCLILMVGGHYTYAEVPLFDTLSELFDSERNNYDKVGHFAQGFVPALVAREILIRNKVINSPIWTNFLTVCFCLAFSAFYEMIEWWVALLSEQAAEAFLGTQGYIWDTQSDMAWALVGAMSAIVLFRRLQDRQISSFEISG